MKKMVMALVALASLNAMAVELQIKGGYDVFRFQSKENTLYKEGKQLERGFVVNTELFPLNQLRVEPGIGIEYNFSNKTPGYGIKSDSERYHHIPVYGIVKANIIKKENGDSPLAAVAKLGYAFVQKTQNADKPGSGGLYYGLGVNGEYGPFVVELLASRTHLLVPLKDAQPVMRTAAPAGAKEELDKGDITKVGLTAGFRIGKLHKDVTPVEEAPVELMEPVVEEAPVVETPTVEVVEKPEVKVEPTIEQIELQAEALFNFDKSDLANMLEEGKDQIRELADILTKDYVKVQAIQVVGHTDRLGSEKYNMALGQRRANTVKEFLHELGVTAEITAISKGESEPKKHCKGKKATKALKDCLLENRRVEINVVGQKFSE